MQNLDFEILYNLSGEELYLKALEYKNNKQSNFAIKSDNSKHITESLG